jgi:hypothetical protein
MDPHNPEQAGSQGVEHDGRSDADHEKEANKGIGHVESDKKEDEDEGEEAKKDNETDE